MTKDEGRIALLIEAADDLVEHANELLNQAPNMGRSKEQSYRRVAADTEARAKELREWAAELRAAQDEPGGECPPTDLFPDSLHHFVTSVNGMRTWCKKCGVPQTAEPTAEQFNVENNPMRCSPPRESLSEFVLSLAADDCVDERLDKPSCGVCLPCRARASLNR